MLLVGSVLSTCTPAEPAPGSGLSGTANPLPGALWVDVTDEVLDSTAEWSNKVELADLDGDGWLDILFANGGNYSTPGDPEPNRVFMNRGPGQRFEQRTSDVLGPRPDISRVIKARDFNGDGDVDIFVGTTYQTQSRLFLGLGGGAFEEVTSTHLPRIDLSLGDAEPGDVDGDGDLVLADWGPGNNMTNRGGRTRLWLNDGGGRFTDVTSARMPETLVRFSWEVELVDVDNDYDLDVLVSCKRCPGSLMFTNDGSGVFEEARGLPQYTNNYEFEAMDLDGDGFLDLVTINDGDIVGGRGSSRREHVFINNGEGRFADMTDVLWLTADNIGEDDTRGLAKGGSGRERYPMGYLQRDWVVKAFNADMPYAKFVMAHLAADLMPEAERTELLPALGFLGQGPWYYDIADPPVARADERHDRVDVTSRAFLGLTVGCARCHDHKYDPIGQHDYYSLDGIFDNTVYYEYPVADSATAAEFKSDQEFIKSLEEGLTQYLRTEGEQLSRVLTLQTSQYMMAAWKVTGEEQIPVERAASQGRLDLETLERWIDFLADEPNHYPYLVPWQEMIADGGGTEEAAQELADAFQRLLLEIVAEQQELEERNAKIIARGTPLEEVKSTPMPNGFESFFDKHQLELDAMERERFNLFSDVFRSDLDNEIDTFFRNPALMRFSAWGLERQLSRGSAAHVAATREEIKELKEELPDIPFVMGVRDKDEGAIEDIGLHLRGNPNNLGARVPRSFLHVLDEDAPSYEEGSGRLGLAEDIAQHPITARVIVNRVWAWHMGSGIVPSPSNFGFAGDPPTNPELLEFLAARFVDNGMSIKQLHRDIMLSSVYQLSADGNPAFDGIDPDNRYYWRFNRQRLGAEAIRDALLYTSGNLDAEVGGKSLLLESDVNNRRTIYGEVSRFQVNEYLQTFDFPNPSLTAERRFSTNVPLQSLYFMNSPFVQRQAEAFVKRLATETEEEEAGENGGAQAAASRSDAADDDQEEKDDDADDADSDDAEDDKDKDLPKSFDDRAMIATAYPILYGRAATDQEIQLGTEFLTEQRASWLEQVLEEMAKEAADEKAAGTNEPAAGAETDAVAGSDAAADSDAVADPDAVADSDAEAASDNGQLAKAAADRAELAARRASMEAWVQYARALFSAAEFRFID